MDRLTSGPTALQKSLLATFVLGALVHVRSLANELTFDDRIRIAENPLLRQSDGWLRLWSEPIFPGNLYRPIVTAVDWILFQSCHLNPLPYHVVNLLLHGAVTVLVFLLLARRFEKKAAWWTAVLFSALPIHTESVASVAGKAELLAAMFGLAAMYVSSTQRSVIAAAALAFCAYLSKESAYTLPLLCCLVTPRALRLRSVLTLMTPLALALVVRFIVVGHGPWPIDPLDNPLVVLDGVTRIVTALILLGRYEVVALLPFKLSPDYSFNALGPLLSSTTCSGLYLGVLLATCWAAVRSNTVVGFAARWFLVAFAIPSNVFFPIGTIFADRLVYVPSIGLAAGAAHLLYKNCAPLITVHVVAILVTLSVHQDGIWRNDRTLFDHATKVAPQSAKSHHNRSVALRNAGLFDEASVEARAAVQIFPRYADALSTLGTLYLHKNMSAGAEHWFHKALAVDAEHLPTLIRLGKLYFNRGDTELAGKKCGRAAALAKENVEASVCLYAIAIREEKKAEASELAQWLDIVAFDNAEYQALKRQAQSQ